MEKDIVVTRILHEFRTRKDDICCRCGKLIPVDGIVTLAHDRRNMLLWLCKDCAALSQSR